jgi:hypothetical protein
MPAWNGTHAVILLLRTQIAPRGVEAAQMGRKRNRLIAAVTASQFRCNEDHTNHIALFSSLCNGSQVFRAQCRFIRKPGPALPSGKLNRSLKIAQPILYIRELSSPGGKPVVPVHTYRGACDHAEVRSAEGALNRVDCCTL